MSDQPASEAVRRLYERHPFPQRDPASEATHLYVTGLDSLGKINHYCFGGRQAFGGGFRALVAGGGTGDAAIYLAEQLRGRDAEVVYLDLSAPSMRVAQQRAAVRKLDNLRWHQGSLLELEASRFGRFDYINCAGVLHHLPDPAAGLAALARVMREDGAMGLMLYGRAGRQDIYFAQELMRIVNRGEPDVGRQVENARGVLAALPATNWLLRNRSREKLLQQFERDAADLVDTFLHVQDRAYSVAQVYELLDGARLSLIAFTSFLAATSVGTRLEYDPALYVRDPRLLARIGALPLRQQQAAAELMSGAISLHTFYAARSADRAASFRDPAAIPFFLTAAGRASCAGLAASPGKPLTVEIRPGVSLAFDPGAQARQIAAAIDDRRAIGELAAALEERTLKDLEIMCALDWIALRHAAVPRVAPLGELVDVQPRVGGR